jgi:hypothetical protein
MNLSGMRIMILSTIRYIFGSERVGDYLATLYLVGARDFDK